MNTGDPHPQFEPFATMEKDKINVTRIVLGSHTGTHVDAPIHFFADGNGVDKEPSDKVLSLLFPNFSIFAGLI